MSDYQARIALARDAYQATQPSASELKASTARVEAQLTNPVNHMRRLLQFLGGGALLGAGLLATLSSAPSQPVQPAAIGSLGLGESVPSEPSAGVARLGLPQGWVQPLKLDPESERREAEPNRVEASGRTGARAANRDSASIPGDAMKAAPKTGSAAAPPDWSQVSSALADGDPARAGRVLEGLAANGDADTRAKALLGQAQLAFSRGDRAEAKRLTRAAASVPGASSAVREKALRWAARASL